MGSSHLGSAFSASEPIVLVPQVAGKPDSLWDSTFHSISPVFSNGWALLGEPSKWVSVSEDRFTDVTELPTGLVVKLRGSPGETVIVAFKEPDKDTPKLVSCVVPQSSTVKIVSSTGKCAETL